MIGLTDIKKLDVGFERQNDVKKPQMNTNDTYEDPVFVAFVFICGFPSVVGLFFSVDLRGDGFAREQLAARGGAFGDGDDAADFEKFEDVADAGLDGVDDELAAVGAAGFLRGDEPADGGGIDVGKAFEVEQEAVGAPLMAEEIVEVGGAGEGEIDGSGFAFGGDVEDAGGIVTGKERERKGHAGPPRR
jgi:hypothetical protein